MKVFVLLFACVCFASASRIASEAQVSKATDDVENAPLVPLEPEDAEVSENRMWNPFKGIAAKAQSACSCPNGDKCQCCFGIPFLGYQGCLTGRLVEGQIELQLALANVFVVNKQFPLAGKEEVCGALPKAMSALSFCLTVAANPIPGGVSSCAGVDFRINGQVGAAMNFQCLDARGGKLSVGNYAKLTQGGSLNFNVKTPFVAFTQAFKNKRAH